MKFFLARHGRAVLGIGLCVAAVLAAALYGGFNHRVRSADVLSGEWTGNVLWNSASGRAFDRTIHTALYFQTSRNVGIVLSFPGGAIGGAGLYTLQDGRLTITCDRLNINGRELPMTMFSKENWFHDTATYTATFDGTHLTLANPAAAQPTPAPAYPLLVSPKAIVLSRMDEPADSNADPIPRE